MKSRVNTHYCHKWCETLKVIQGSNLSGITAHFRWPIGALLGGKWPEHFHAAHRQVVYDTYTNMYLCSRYVKRN